MRKVIFFIGIIVLMGCASQKKVKDVYMTSEEVAGYVDSLARIYYVDAKLNRNYLERHPLRFSEREKLKDAVVYASPISSYQRPADSLGVFRALPMNTDEDKAKVQRLADSISHATRYTHSMLEETEMLTDRHKLVYSLAFHRMDTSMELQKQRAVVIDLQSSDSIDVEMKNMCFSVLSNPPLVYALAFSIEFGGRKYVVHYLYDIRTFFNRGEDKFQKTKGCYVVKDDD